MRWPWNRRPPCEGELARMEAERRLAEERRRTQDVIALASDLRALRRRNHFAEAISKAMGVER